MPGHIAVPQGTLVVVGTGISAFNQLTTEARGWIERADLVCYAVSEPLSARWIQQQARQWLDLTSHYNPALPRRQSYAAMAAEAVEPLRKGMTVAMALYGHPGIAAAPGHLAIQQARELGHRAWMLPGISAADVLFADLGIDPCWGGCQWMEATDFVRKQRPADPYGHLILWQIGILNQAGFTPGHRYRSDLAPLLAELLRVYPANHQVIHYQAAQQVVFQPLIEEIELGELCTITATGASTLVIPPLHPISRSAPHSRPFTGRQPPFGPARVGSPQPQGDPDDDRLGQLIKRLAHNPHEWLAYQQDRGGYLAAADLDPVERWAVLRQHRALVRKALELGSAVEAFVELGLAANASDALACCSRWLERSDERRLQGH